MDVTLKVPIEDAKAIIATLGQLPTSSGAWPLLMNISQQVSQQEAANRPPPPEVVP